MHNLAHCPTSRAVWSIKLPVIQVRHGAPQVRRESLNVMQPSRPVRRSDGPGWFEATHRILKILPGAGGRAHKLVILERTARNPAPDKKNFQRTGKLAT
jgi:hypothetical protein